MENLGLRIKQARKRKKMTQQDLAEKVGISKHAIAKYEQGQREPKLAILTKMIDALDVDFWEIVEETDFEIEPVTRENNYKEDKDLDYACNWLKVESKLRDSRNSHSNVKSTGWVMVEKYRKVRAQLEILEIEEYISRITVEMEDIDEVQLDLFKFRYDFYEELDEAIRTIAEAMIDIKLKEAKRMIKDY